MPVIGFGKYHGPHVAVPVPPVGLRLVLDVPSLLSVKPAERRPVVPDSVLMQDAVNAIGPLPPDAMRTCVLPVT
jgi:hypothetical protein